MAKRTRTFGRPTVHAVEALGHQVAAGRRRRGWTATELADRLGVSPGTVRKIESGNPTVAVGLMFEAAVLSGVDLFDVWDGESLTLTPAYDLAPMARTGATAAQAMAIDADGRRDARLRVCRNAAPIYQLDRSDAEDIIDQTVTTIRESWNDVVEHARLTATEAQALWERQFLNPAIFYDDVV